MVADEQHGSSIMSSGQRLDPLHDGAVLGAGEKHGAEGLVDGFQAFCCEG